MMTTTQNVYQLVVFCSLSRFYSVFRWIVMSKKGAEKLHQTKWIRKRSKISKWNSNHSISRKFKRNNISWRSYISTRTTCKCNSCYLSTERTKNLLLLFYPWSVCGCVSVVTGVVVVVAGVHLNFNSLIYFGWTHYTRVDSIDSSAFVFLNVSAKFVSVCRQLRTRKKVNLKTKRL